MFCEAPVFKIGVSVHWEGVRNTADRFNKGYCRDDGVRTTASLADFQDWELCGKVELPEKGAEMIETAVLDWLKARHGLPRVMKEAQTRMLKAQKSIYPRSRYVRTNGLGEIRLSLPEDLADCDEIAADPRVAEMAGVGDIVRRLFDAMHRY